MILILVVILLIVLSLKYEHFTSESIPKIMYRSSHFTRETMPLVVKNVLALSEKQNPEYELQYYNDDDCRDFIQLHYPEYIYHYNKLIPSAYKSDLWRLLILYHYGGVYNDIGHQYTRPLSMILQPNDEFVVAWESHDFTGKYYVLHNAFIAVYPRHPLIWNTVKAITKNIEHEDYGIDHIDITSCRALGREFNKFFGRDCEATIRPGNYEYGNFKARILQFNCCDSIYDTTGKIINTKFENYYDVMYSGDRNVLSYKNAWIQRRVFV